MANKQDRYTMDLTCQILNLFKNEKNREDVQQIDLSTIDATMFFTSMVYACTHVYNQMTGDNKNFLEFTHLANQLIVQDMMENKKQGEL